MLEARLPAEARQRPEDLQKDFLRQVQRLVVVVEQMKRELVDHALVLGHESRARRLVAGDTLR